MSRKINSNPEIGKSLPNISSLKDESFRSLKKKWKSGVVSIASKAQGLLEFGDSPVRPNMKRRGAIANAADIKPALMSAVRRWRREEPASPSRKSSEWQMMKKRERSVDNASFGSPIKSISKFLNKEVSSEKTLWTSHPWSQALTGRASPDRPSTSKVIETVQPGTRKSVVRELFRCT